MVDVAANREAQRQMYGEPLGGIVDRCRSVLGVTQARIAALLGISAPMLSQVMSGQRIRIGNPEAVQRLQVMVEAVEAVEAGQIAVEEAVAQIAAAQTSADVLTGTTRRAAPRDTASAIQALFRRVASATECLEAAAAIESTHPEIARVLRTYGAGRLDDAVAHLTQKG